jgi:hypothetical protein
MRLSRLFAFTLAAITAIFVLIAWAQDEAGGITLGILSTAAVIIALPSFSRSRGVKSRWLLAGASALYVILALASLGLQYAEQGSLFVRGAVCAGLMLGVLLCLRCAYQLNRTTRYGFHNYYDRPN